MKLFLSLILCCGLAVGVLIGCGSDDEGDGGEDGGEENNTCRDLCEKGVECEVLESGDVELWLCTIVCNNYPDDNDKNCALDCPLSLTCIPYAKCLLDCEADLW